MKKYILWMSAFSIIPLFTLFLFKSLGFSEIIDHAILLIVLVIFLIIMPKDFEDIDLQNEKIFVRLPVKKRLAVIVSPKRMGLSIGITFVILYLGCVLMMHFLGHDGTVQFFNNMFHGIDTSNIIKTHFTITKAVAGVIELFMLGTLIGICIGGFYNILQREDD